MRLFTYTGKHSAWKRLEARIRGLVSEQDHFACSKLELFEAALRDPASRPSMALILAGSREELGAILEFAELLGGIKTILIVPDRHPDTTSLAFRLHPRYVGYMDSDFMDVRMVMTRMLEPEISSPSSKRRPGRLPTGNTEPN